MQSGNREVLNILLRVLPMHSNFLRGLAKLPFSQMNRLTDTCSLNTFPANIHGPCTQYSCTKQSEKKQSTSFARTEPKLYSLSNEFVLSLPDNLIAGHLIK